MKKIALLATIAITLCLGLFAYADTPVQPVAQDVAVAIDSQAYDGDICEASAEDAQDESALAMNLAMEAPDAMTTQTCQVCTSNSQCDTICGGDGGVCLRAFGTCGYWFEKICTCW